jgi:hypothetical protein
MPQRHSGDFTIGPSARRGARLPLWPKIVVTAYVAVLVPIYWRAYGPGNFLWFSDLALFALAVALWRESALIASMAAVGVLALEIAWTLDFLTGGQVFHLAAYMYDDSLPLGLRALSGFHLFIPPALILMLARLGYDRRALVAQIVVAWTVLLVTWLLTAPEKNINWVYGWGTEPQHVMSPTLYLGLIMAALPVIVFLPTHIVLKRVFPPPDDAAAGRDSISDSY